MPTLPHAAHVRKRRPARDQAELFPEDDPVTDREAEALERWLPIAGWPLYEVSDFGRVRSWARKGLYGVRADSPHIIKPVRMKAGHFQVGGTAKGYRTAKGKKTRAMALVHRLVLLAFVGPPPVGCTVCRHLDGNPANNRLSNLVWGSMLENAEDRLVHGRQGRHVEEEVTPFYFSDPFIPVEAVIPVEVWRPLPGYPRYEISNWGRIGSFWNIFKGQTVASRYILATRINKAGYDTARIKDSNGVMRSHMVHRLILQTFSPRDDDAGLDCRHLNGIPSDNRIANLRWSTRAENARDRILHGTQARGSRTGGAKLTDAKVVEIRRRHDAGELDAHLSIEFGVNQATICCIVKRRTWKHVP